MGVLLRDVKHATQSPKVQQLCRKPKTLDPVSVSTSTSVACFSLSLSFFVCLSQIISCKGMANKARKRMFNINSH